MNQSRENKQIEYIDARLKEFRRWRSKPSMPEKIIQFVAGVKYGPDLECPICLKVLKRKSPGRWMQKAQKCSTNKKHGMRPFAGTVLGRTRKREWLYDYIFLIVNWPNLSSGEITNVSGSLHGPDMTNEISVKIRKIFARAFRGPAAGESWDLFDDMKNEVKKIRKKGLKVDAAGFISLHSFHVWIPDKTFMTLKSMRKANHEINEAPYFDKLFDFDQLVEPQRTEIDRFLFALALLVKSKSH